MSAGTDQMMIMRHHAIKELVDTEVRYGEKLSKLYEAYFLPMRASLPQQQLRTIFTTFEAIRQCQLKFQTELSAKFVLLSSGDGQAAVTAAAGAGVGGGGGGGAGGGTRRRSTTTDVSGDNSIIKVVQRFSPFFRMYQQYVAGYQESLRTLTEVRKDKTLADLLAKGSDSCQVEIGSLLIEPVQRIPRYKMLMEEIRRHTPAHMVEDVAALDETCAEVAKVRICCVAGPSTVSQRPYCPAVVSRTRSEPRLGRFVVVTAACVGRPSRLRCTSMRNHASPMQRSKSLRCMRVSSTPQKTTSRPMRASTP